MEVDDLLDEVADLCLSDDIVDTVQADARLQQALLDGVNLREYTQQVESELQTATQQYIDQHISHVDAIAELHFNISSFDEVLHGMEEILGTFRDNISAMSDEIQSMQDLSVGLSIQLANRKQIEQNVATFLRYTVLHPQIIHAVCTAEPSEAYIDYLDAIDDAHTMLYNLPESSALRRTVAVSLAVSPHAGGRPVHNFGKRPAIALPDPEPGALEQLRQSLGELQWQETPVGLELCPLLTQLTTKAIDQVRQFLLQKIAMLKKPKTNISILQQSMLKFKKFFHFLLRHHPVAAQEVKHHYVHTLSHIYQSKTGHYIASLRKLEMGGVTRPNVLVEKDKSLLGTTGTYSIMGTRWEVLDALTSAIIVPHIELQGKRKHFFENIFRSLNLMLMDIITAEYLFSFDFFHDSELFIPIFDKTIPAFLDTLKDWAAGACDHIAILLSIRMTQQFFSVMQRRRIPCLNTYFEQITVVLWPRFKHIFDVNVEALRLADPKDLLGKTGTGVCKLSERFAEFSGAILVAMLHGTNRLDRVGPTTNSAPDSPISGASPVVEPPPTPEPPLEDHGEVEGCFDMLAANMGFLRLEFENKLQAMGQLFKDRREECVFLLNNIYHVHKLWRQHGIRPAEVDHQSLLRTLAAAQQTFVEAELHETFPEFISFLKDAEPLLSKLVDPIAAVQQAQQPVDGAPATTSQAQRQFETNRSKLNVARLQELAVSFSGSWKQGIDATDSRISRRIADREHARQLLQAALTQLVLYNVRFNGVIAKCWLNPPFRTHLVSHQLMLHEVKARVGALENLSPQSPPVPSG
eukprot:TRINITY_DN9610_c0_g1_i1.p1 TRINITY_DN9610_c0_g1~~TRINITY_DN9610_c0_g1_i1.p1  ORF type:complete len:814 (-),score=178.36 TRINITY_DN9610_c0_g1_i1:92-2509(-)